MTKTPQLDKAPVLPARYEPKAVLGNGRFSTVRHCFDSELQRDVALKIGDLAGRDEIAIKRMRRELRISCQLRHPNVASALDGFETNGRIVLVLPLCDGGPIETMGVTSRRTLRERLTQMMQVATAVAYVHSRGIAHGDIKPENILLDDRQEAHLADFGSCQSLRVSNETESAAAVGSPVYLAPELASGQSPPTIASDVYAMGATLYTVLVGKPPYEGDVHAVLKQITLGRFPNVRQSNPTLPASLGDVIGKACHVDPSRRYADADSYKSDLQAVLANRPIAARPPTAWTRVNLWRQRNPTAARLAIALAALVTVGSTISTAGWVVGQRRASAILVSREKLEQQGAEAFKRETELTDLLAAIDRNQTLIEQSLAEETRLKAEAAAVASLAKQQADRAEKNLAEATRLATQLASLKEQQATAEKELETIAETTAWRDRYLDYLDRRRLVNDQLIAANEASGGSGKFVNIHAVLRGFASMNASATHTTDRGNAPPISISIPSPVTGMTWSPTGHDVAIFGEFDHVKIIHETYDDDDPSVNGTGRMVQWMNANPTSRLVEFVLQSTPGSERRLMLSQKTGPHTHQFRIVDYVEKTLVKDVTWDDFNGTVHAIRCRSDGLDHSMIALCSDPATGDLQWIDVEDRVVRWSCLADRSSFGLSPEPGKPLLPYFVDVGSDRYRQVVLLSSPPTKTGEPSPVVLHAFDVGTSDPNKFAMSLDLKAKTISNWPSSLQLSDEVVLGTGVGALNDNRSGTDGLSTPSAVDRSQRQSFQARHSKA